MNRLITFGCSHTAGYSLPNRDKQVWGKIVSDHFKRRFVNQGIHGASNKLICHQIKNFNFLPDDLVIILWTYKDRYTKFLKKDSFEGFNPTHTHPGDLAKIYFKYLHSDYDADFINKIFINYTLYSLIERKVKFYFAGITLDYLNECTENNSFNLPIDFRYYNLRYIISESDNHMGVQGNIAFGNQIAKEILKLENRNIKGFNPISYNPI